jgi:nicotinamide-nucleotide amidase
MSSAEIIAAGSELLTPSKIDTNSLWLTAELNNVGVEVIRKSVVGDDRERLTAAIRGALESARVTIVGGGLGPTEDDLTRDAAAAALGRELVFNQEICDAIEERFRRFNRKMVAINRRQAYVVAGAEVLPNDRGTAPGQWIEDRGRVLILLPGPPNELKAMFTSHCVARLQRVLPPRVIRTRQFRVAGMPESDLDELIAPIYTRYTNPVTTILSNVGGIDIHLRAQCNSEQEAEALLEEIVSQIEPLLAPRIVSRNGEPIEKIVGDLLRSRGARLCVAESATGGMLGEWITSVPNSSDYFLGGFLVYSDEMKMRLLGVQGEMLAAHTAVSEPVAKAMAEGARERTGADYALSVTGYAGPDGDDVGTMFIGLAGPEGTEVRRVKMPGDRNRIRALTVQNSLDFLRRRLVERVS